MYSREEKGRIGYQYPKVKRDGNKIDKGSRYGNNTGC